MALRRPILCALNKLSRYVIATKAERHYSGEWGCGAGKGGGSGGAVRDAGGGFGKMEAAREEYFKKLQRKQLMKLKQHIKEEVSYHEKMIEQHKEAIARHTSRIADLKNQVQEQKN